MGLHLRYRLWIAEMNSDISVLRIFDDYLKELRSKRNEDEAKHKIEDFQKQFTDLRNEIDELRDNMHILKMKLAALSRENKTLDKDTFDEDKHEELKKKYFAFRKTFDETKDAFISFGSKWL
jgi:uncharacterized coiled-coil DUF342 family protein